MGINLTKEVNDLYSENCETLIIKNQRISMNINRKAYHVHGLEELILLKLSYNPKSSTDSMKFLTKCQWHFFYRSKKHS